MDEKTKCPVCGNEPCTCPKPEEKETPEVKETPEETPAE